MVCKKVFQTTTIHRDKTLEYKQLNHPAFCDVRRTLEEMHVSLVSDDRYKKVFHDLHTIGFKSKNYKIKKSKNLRDNLLSLQLPDIDEISSTKPLLGKRPSIKV